MARTTFLVLAFSALVAAPAFAQHEPQRDDRPRPEFRERTDEAAPRGPRRERFSRPDDATEARPRMREQFREQFREQRPDADRREHRRFRPGGEGRMRGEHARPFMREGRPRGGEHGMRGGHRFEGRRDRDGMRGPHGHPGMHRRGPREMHGRHHGPGPGAMQGREFDGPRRFARPQGRPGPRGPRADADRPMMMRPHRPPMMRGPRDGDGDRFEGRGRQAPRMFDDTRERPVPRARPFRTPSID